MPPSTPENFKYIIEQSLRGPAYEWWENIEPYVTSVRDFRERFTAKYWGEGVQNKIRRELEFRFYHGDGLYTRSEYVMSLYNDVKMLADAPPTPLIMDKFSRHFDAGTQQTIITRRLRTIDELVETLDSLEQIGEVNSTFAMQQLNASNTFTGGQTERNRQLDPRGHSNNSSFRAQDVRASTPRPLNSNRELNSNWCENRPYRPSETPRIDQATQALNSTAREAQAYTRST